MNSNELRAEMARHSDTGTSLAAYLGISPVTVSMKINGKSDFTQGEICKIRARYDLTPERIDEIFFDVNVSK